MAREEKVWEYAIEAGYEPLEDRCIIVKGAAGDLSERSSAFRNMGCGGSPDVRERAHPASIRVLWGTLERDVSLVVPYADIESVKLTNDLLNVIIDIETSGGSVRLTSQQKGLSDSRLSGIYASQYAGGYKNWHAENVDATLKALSELGSAA